MPAWTPASLTGAEAPIAWFDAAATYINGGTPADNDAIETWHDRSGNDTDLSQPILAERPLWSESFASLGNQPAVYFDGAAKGLSNPAITTTSAKHTLFIVGHDADPGLTRRFLADSNSFRFIVRYVSGQLLLTVFDSGAYRDVGYSSGATFIQSVVSDSTVSWWVNGTYSVASAYPEFVVGGILFGAEAGTSGAGLLIPELILIDSAVSTETRQKIEGYLAHRYGLEGELPEDHPYYSAAPVDLDPASNPDPEDGGISTPEATLTWTGDAAATAFDVYLWKSSESQPGTPTVEDLATASYDTGRLAYSTEYSWTVTTKEGDASEAGSTWTFTTTAYGGIREQILANIETVLDETRPFVCAHRAQLAGPSILQHPTVVVFTGSESKEEDNSGHTFCRLDVHVNVYGSARSDVEAEASQYIIQIERALAVDPHRGGVAFDTQAVENDIYVPDVNRPQFIVAMLFQVTYRHDHGKPDVQS